MKDRLLMPMPPARLRREPRQIIETVGRPALDI